MISLSLRAFVMRLILASPAVAVFSVITSSLLFRGGFETLRFIWGSFSGCLPLSSFSCVSPFTFLPVAYLPSVAPVLPPVSPFPSLVPLFPPLVLSSSPVVSFASPAFLLAPPVSSLIPPVAVCSLLSDCPPVPPVALLSHSLASLLALVVFFLFACRLLLSLFYRLPFVVYSHFLPFSCRILLSFVTPAVITCAFLSDVPFAAPALSLVPHFLFSSFLLLLFLVSPNCRLRLLFLELLLLLSSPRIFSLLLSSLLVLMPFYWVWIDCSLLYVPQFFKDFFYFLLLTFNLLLSNFLLLLLSFIVVLFSF